MTIASPDESDAIEKVTGSKVKVSQWWLKK